MDVKKNILIIIPQVGSGGAERVAVNISNQMVKDGYSVTICTILSNREDYRLDEGVLHIHLDVYHKIKAIRIPMRFVALRNIVKKGNWDAVIAFDRNYGVTASLFSGKKVIASERNDPYSNMPRRSIQKHYRDWLYRKADVVVFQTEYARDYFSEKIKSHSTIIPNPVDSHLCTTSLNCEKENVIIAACRFTKQKNIPMMIEAFSMFTKDHPEYRLKIYGEGPLQKEVEELIGQFNLKEKVSLPGYSTDLISEMTKSAMYISSSDYEGISNTMLEAMAVGLPVVCTDCPAGGAKLAIENGVNGFLVSTNDSKAMYEKMKLIVENDDIRQSISNNARNVNTRFSIEKITAMWESLC